MINTPHTPRQKMINLLYLVFVAMILPEVSPKEIPIVPDKTEVDNVREPALSAHLIPRTAEVVKGTFYEARIILCGADTMQPNAIYVNKEKVPEAAGGWYRIPARETGIFPVEGYIEVPDDDGSCIRYPFKSEYRVVEPAVSVTSLASKVLYAGIENVLQVSASGVNPQHLHLSATNGTVIRKDQNWVLNPYNVRETTSLSVSVRFPDGSFTPLSTTVFQVCSLPDPLLCMEYADEKGNYSFFVEKLIPYRKLKSLQRLTAVQQNELQGVEWTVVCFNFLFFDSLGNITPESSDGNQLSAKQKARIHRLSRGNRFYITQVQVKGPGGTERVLPTIELTVD